MRRIRLFREEVCAQICKGKKAVHVCRQMRLWREEKCKIFSDIVNVDFDCPYGLPINNDNYLSKRPNIHDTIASTAGMCKDAEETGLCCSRRFRCKHPARYGYELSARSCNFLCRFYVRARCVIE